MTSNLLPVLRRDWSAPILSQKQTAVTRAVVTGLRGPQWTPANYELLAREGYCQNVLVFRCVEYIAAACAGIEWNLYQKYSRSQREKDPGHPLLVMLRRPNELQTGSTFVHAVIAYRELSGNAYIERVGPKRGAPRELWTHRPDRMKVVPGNAVQPVAGYVYEVNGQKIAFDAEQILHWRSFNPLSDWYGMSPIEAAARSIDQNNQARSWNKALLDNSARPPGGFFSDQPLADDQFERLRALIDERYSGAANAGRPLLMEGGLQWQEFGLSPVEMAWIEGLKLSSREICTAFGVPPELVGDTANKTYNNYGQSRKAFYEETVLPLMDSFRDALNGWLTPEFGDRLRLDYNRDDIEALQEDRDKLWVRVDKVSFLTPNEKREAVGYEAYQGEGAEEADMLRMPAQTAPIDAVSTFEMVDADGKPVEKEDDEKQAKAWDRIARADWLTPQQKCELTGFDYQEPAKADSAPPPVINVTSPAVHVETPPVVVNLTLPSGTKTIRRDAQGRMTAIEETSNGEEHPAE